MYLCDSSSRDRVANTVVKSQRRMKLLIIFVLGVKFEIYISEIGAKRGITSGKKSRYSNGKFQR